MSHGHEPARSESRTHLSLLTVQPGKALFQNTYVAKVQGEGGWPAHADAPRGLQPPKENAYEPVQSHLTIDFPIKAPGDAKALTEELPPLMPDFAKVQDELGTVHFSRFMVEGDETLLFLSDIDGEVDKYIGQLVESSGPVFDTIFKHVEDPPATPVASNSQAVIKWLKQHNHEPMLPYVALSRTPRFRTSRRPLVRRALRAIPGRTPG